ncbi:transcription factor IIA alpha/beta subunit [Amanita muscaria]
MSNKIVPAIYRAVIEDVISSIKPDFEEYGVDEDILAELKRKWQEKVLASRVADFDAAQPPPPPQVPQVPQQHHPYPPHPIHMVQPPYPGHNPYGALPVPGQPAVKSEPMDGRYMLHGLPHFALPPLAPPSLTNGRQLPPPIPHPGGQTGVLSFPRAQASSTPSASPRPFPSQPAAGQPSSQPPPPTAAAAALQSQQAPLRIPQVDGPSESSGEEDSPSPPHSQAFAPRPSHPSLPQPALNPPATASREDSEAINSDLDDSDTEGEEEAEEGTVGETDIVFCTYDKVARVKNKWKCILKDGMIHINGRDYLFAKCTGEFEW